MVGLIGICLVERFRTHLELQIFHGLEDMVITFKYKDVLIAYRIITLLIIEIE